MGGVRLGVHCLFVRLFVYLLRSVVVIVRGAGIRIIPPVVNAVAQIAAQAAVQQSLPATASQSETLRRVFSDSEEKQTKTRQQFGSSRNCSYSLVTHGFLVNTPTFMTKEKEPTGRQSGPGGGAVMSREGRPQSYGCRTAPNTRIN